jgi:biotin carboxylase
MSPYPTVQVYGFDPMGDSPIDFDNLDRIPPNGHCIAVRITAENPDLGFKPTSGTIQVRVGQAQKGYRRKSRQSFWQD